MENIKQKIIPLCIGVLSFSIVLCAGIYAWDEPTAAPPTPNASSPVNTGTTTQNKSGGLNIAGNVGIGTTNPGANLHVYQGSASSANVKIESSAGSASNLAFATNGTNKFLVGSVGDGSYFRIYSYGAGGQSVAVTADGNVGIGTASPNAKLNVIGSTNLSRDNTGECCSSGDYTLSLAESTSATSKKAGIQFHNSGVSEGQFRLDNGINGREFQAFSYQTDMDLHATGYVQGDQGLCIGTSCRTSWPAGVIAQTCPTGQGMIGIDGSGNIICSGSGLTLSFPCNGALPTGAKKIFITSTLYSGNDANTETVADAKCQSAANTVGFSGTYKALVYMGNRSPLSVLTSGQTFWNGQKIGATCNWNMVAANPADFFTDDGGGVYLRNSILYNEQGSPMNNVVVWTGFAGNGDGSMQTLGYSNQAYACGDRGPYATNGRLGACLGRHAFYSLPYGNAAPCNDSAEWYGIASNKARGWSYNVSTLGPNGADTFAMMNQCGAQTRAFYCVEQ